MFDAMFWGAIGTFIGWNLPQPFWARYVQAKMVEAYHNFRAK